MFWLHEKGYNFFNISKLTYQEINCLVDANRRRAKKQEQEARKIKGKRQR